MNNSIIFKYNGKIWNPKNPEKKLKQLGITWDDVEIINNEEVKEEVIEYQNPKLYVFKNKDTEYIIESIYDNLDHLKDVDGYEYAAARDHYGKYLIQPNYINAGVLLFNMPQMRRTGIFEKARNLIKTKELL